MPEFIVRVTRVEAESEAQAIEMAKERGCRDFDEVDPQVATTFSVELDPDALPAPAPKM